MWWDRHRRECERYEINLINITTINFFHRNNIISGHTRSNTLTHAHPTKHPETFPKRQPSQSMIFCVCKIFLIFSLTLSSHFSPSSSLSLYLYSGIPHYTIHNKFNKRKTYTKHCALCISKLFSIVTDFSFQCVSVCAMFPFCYSFPRPQMAFFFLFIIASKRQINL